MFSLKSAVLFACIAFVAAHPFFRERQRNREGQEPEGEYPREGEPMNQVAFPSYDGAGAGTDANSESAEVVAAGGSLGGGATVDVDGSDFEAGENEAGENEAAEAAAAAADGDSPDAVEAAAGGMSGTGSANNLGRGGKGKVAKRGEQSMAGRNAGIAFGVLGVVGLAAGIGFFAYRKRRAAAYGARF